jgi:hypothetical protein
MPVQYLGPLGPRKLNYSMPAEFGILHLAKIESMSLLICFQHSLLRADFRSLIH